MLQVKREETLSRQEIIVSTWRIHLRGANAPLRCTCSHSEALCKSIINIFVNTSIFVRSCLEGNVQFHRCTTVITENSTSASAQPLPGSPPFHRERLVRTSISLLSTSLLATPNQFSHTNSARSRNDDVASV